MLHEANSANEATATLPGDAREVSFTVPIKAESLNKSGRQTHWGQRSRLAKKHRAAVADVVGLQRIAPPALPCLVLLTRCSPSNGLDGDNLQGSLKACRDGVAAWIGVDDRDERVQWKYAQLRTKGYEVRVAAVPLED